MKQFSIFLVFCSLVLTGCGVEQVPVVSEASAEARIDVRIRWAKEHIRKGEYEEAKRPLTGALEVDKGSPKALNLLAFVFQQQGDMLLAEEYYKRMLKSDASFAPGRNNYGIFLMIQNRYDEACPHLAAASNDPLYTGRPQALENLAGCYQLAGQQELSEETYRRVLRLTPNSAITLIELASLVYERGESGEAWQLFDRFSELVNQRKVEHSAKSLWLGVRLSREGRDPSMAATYALLLKNLFPQSSEYQLYKESRQ